MRIPLHLTVRKFVYDFIVELSRPPSVLETAVSLNITPEETEAVYQQLHDGHFFFLNPGSHDILIANPFSAVPTPFVVHVGDTDYYANCAWDMLGVPAALHADARITAVYTDTQTTLELTVQDGELQAAPGFVHFPLPVRQWYDDLILT